MKRMTLIRAVSGRSGRRRGSQKPGTTAGDAGRIVALACATAGARSQTSPARPRSIASTGIRQRLAPDARTDAERNESGIGVLDRRSQVLIPDFDTFLRRRKAR